MPSSSSPQTAFGVALAVLVSGCASASEPVPRSCLNGPQDVERALRTAPAAVTLADGTRLSVCVARATSDADLQNVGSVFTRAADDLAMRIRNDGVAVRLGYLIGATRRGGVHTAGVTTELVRRVEQDAQLSRGSAATNAALHRGLKAGESGG